MHYDKKMKKSNEKHLEFVYFETAKNGFTWIKPTYSTTPVNRPLRDTGSIVGWSGFRMVGVLGVTPPKIKSNSM